jgi:hypothetical protein
MKGLTMECVNRKERFGKSFRVAYDESYRAQRAPCGRGKDPWLQIIPCRHGHIFPHGGKLLATSTDRREATARKLVVLPGVTVHQDGSDGVTVLFPVDQFDAVAALLLPRRRRVVSEAERERLRTLGAKYRFQHGVQSDSETRPCVGTGLDDTQHVQG